ncbi:hypothetical protein [Apibacter sp. HY039]|uniref:hypothetical protein n=1 Tax=Apibacter sp. HY039 TaxID=2501476 RepID=UPI000FEBD907|nr:hypothetical protein [Apibacter sp. HY039]
MRDFFCKSILLVILSILFNSCNYTIPWGIDKDDIPTLIYKDVYVNKFSESVISMEKLGNGYKVKIICDSVDSLYHHKNSNTIYGYSKIKGYFVIDSNKQVSILREPLRFKLKFINDINE